MTLNLVKYQDEMLKAWKEVVDDKNPTDWALFTYDGQSYDLKLAGKGDGGITELAEDLNSCKIMYAFCRVKDPKTSLPKYVLINWQGESAPGIRKGTCTNHLGAIQKLFKGIHITVNARTEDEVDEEAIIDKVAKSTGSIYNFSRLDSREDEPTGPVGTIYKRVNPTQEIDAKARDSFWAQEEEEEKKRQLEEQRRKEEESKRREEELKKREMEGSRARENQVLARMRSISELRQAEEKANISSEEIEKAKWAKQKQDDDKDDEERRMRSEILRRQRNNEAQSLIKQRSIDAKAIFEQNTSAGQLSISRRSSSSNVSSPSPTPSAPNKVGAKWPPSPNCVSPSPVSPSPASPNPNVVRQTSIQTNFYASNSSNGHTSLISSPPPIKTEWMFESSTPAVIVPPAPEFADAPPELPSSPPPTEQLETSPISPVAAMLYDANQQDYEDVNDEEDQEWESPPQEIVKEVHAENFIDNEVNGFGIRARALYDYQAGEPGEISFDPGDIITNIDQIDEGWWQGVGPDGTYGLFPANYVELIE
uniref:Drebrin-like protein n=1 Tax=Daphnia galeata TaxID=27404 RepID=A0A8J2WJZ6_9CRUS|nr:unnamed protein product [Daphnia galeata]